MIKYIKLTVDQSVNITKIHLNIFPNFFLTTLGYSFLKTYFKSCSKSKEATSICAIDNETKKNLGIAKELKSSHYYADSILKIVNLNQEKLL